MNELLNKLADKKSTIRIVGLGYVGLSLMLRYFEVALKRALTL